jgi:AcrR family transcriptional regulator
VKNQTRGRPRRSDLTDSILATALDLLAREGFDGMRLEDVAAIVGTSKQALYRRWPSKPALVAQAIQHALATANPDLPDTGDLRRDLVTVLSNTFQALESSSFGGAVRALVGETDPELVAAMQAVDRTRRKLLATVLERAVPRRADVELDIDLLLGAAYFRFLLRRVPLGSDLAERVVNAWLGNNISRHRSNQVR